MLGLRTGMEWGNVWYIYDLEIGAGVCVCVNAFNGSFLSYFLLFFLPSAARQLVGAVVVADGTIALLQ